ncbi:RIB43A-like with coiled-coils protein 2 [Bacillus rossius redtenbacheri]|uniref:RIB43A-like with coiled-coils protein 2 n=1 Tax=Bacillus rossius redtenbacheri TaxID=93214 RepID=UPI002FDE3345
MIMLEKDLKEAAAIERRRRFEVERRARIFDARKRVIGVDEAALKMQMEERRAREAEKHRLYEAFEQQRLRDAQLALALEKQAEEERFCVNKAIDTFRSVYQRPEQRREFDLYDPDGLKKALPARVSDDDPRCSLSSAQRFAGEDLAGRERLRAQAQQQRAWLEQQLAERRAADAARRAAEEAHQRALAERAQRAAELDAAERECRRRLDAATACFNKALAEEQEAERKLDEARDREDERAEVYNLVTSDLLTENPDVAGSSLGAHRVVGYKYKGMSRGQLEDIRKEQLRQVEEARTRKAEEEAFNNQWYKFSSDMCNLVMKKDQELTRKQRELNKNILHNNLRLYEEQKSRQEYMDKVVFTNEPTQEYFQQFNTSTR